MHHYWELLQWLLALNLEELEVTGKIYSKYRENMEGSRQITSHWPA